MKLTYEFVKDYIKSFDYTLLSKEYKKSNLKLDIQCDKGHVYKTTWSCFKRGDRCPYCCGNAKKTINEVKQYIESFGYTLLSKEYKNNRTKLQMKCDKGHEFEMTYDNFQQGHRCPYCFGKIKKTIDEIKETMAKENYTLLSKEYKNKYTMLKIKCPFGHIFESKWDNFRNGRRCSICYRNKKHTYDHVYSYIKSKNYTLLSKEYKNSQTKLKIKCNKGHEFEMKYNKFQQGQRCPFCADNKKKSINQIKETMAKENYTLLSKEYKNNKSPLKIKCPNGHVIKKPWSYFQQGYRCAECLKKPIDEIKETMAKENYTLLSKEYKSAHKKIKIQCDRGHTYEATWNYFRNGNRCPTCFYNSISSKAEKEIQEYIAKIYNGTIINNDRNTILNPETQYYLELDVYLPELSKAIEYNGVYWHSLPNSNDKIKKKLCKNKNIDLLIINEENYIENREMCLKVIEKFIKEI